jgi:hypothetical protein
MILKSEGDSPAPIDIRAYSFEEWVRFIFDHPTDDQDWYHREEWSYTAEAGELVRYMTHLFRASNEFLKPYTDRQLETGFWFLMGERGFVRAIWNRDVPLELRQECVRSMEMLCKDFFDKRPIETAAFMWWDEICYDEGHCDPDRFRNENRGVCEAIFEVLCKLLTSRSESCQKNALHGLGHLKHPRTADAIDSFLKTSPDINPELKIYALKCKTGNVR